MFNIFSKDAWAKHEATALGSELEQSQNPTAVKVVAWMQRHKATIGAGFLGFSGWVLAGSAGARVEVGRPSGA